MSNPSADQVYASFIAQYYTSLTKEPEKIHKYYKGAANLTHTSATNVTSTAVGQDEIKELIAKIDFTGFKARVAYVDYQTSLNGSILIVAHGTCCFKEGGYHRFVQTFLLAEQQKGYFVLNDVFRIINDEQTSTTSSVATPATTTTTSATQSSAPSTAATSTQTATAAPVPVESKPTPAAAPAPKPVVAEKAAPAPVESKPTPAATPAQQPKPAAASAPKATPVESKPTPAATPAQQPKPAAAPAPKPAPVESKPTPAATPAQQPKPAAAPKQQPKPVAQQPKKQEKPAEEKPTGPKTYASILAGQGYVPTENPLGQEEAAAAQAPVTSSKQQSSQQKPQQSSEQSQGQDQRFRQQNKRPESAPQRDSEFYKRFIFVAQLPENVTEEELKQPFAEFGKVTQVDIKREKNVAFIGFESQATAQNAIKSNGKINIKGKNIIVDERKPPRVNDVKRGDRPFSSRGGRFPQRNYSNNAQPSSAPTNQ